MIRQTFSNRLRELRKAAGFRSARALAERLEIDENRYTRYERAEVEPSLQLLVQICNTLSVSPNALLDFAAAPTDGSYPIVESTAGGFAETEQPPLRQEGSGTTHGSLEAEAWALAGTIAQLSAERPAGRSTTVEPPQFDQLIAVSELYKRIRSDPFGFSADVLTNTAVSTADQATKERLAQQIASYISRASAS
ncbi:MAG: helix-turn-helix transcriptional regulator [Pseudomonadota bacterium]